MTTRERACRIEGNHGIAGGGGVEGGRLEEGMKGSNTMATIYL